MSNVSQPLRFRHFRAPGSSDLGLSDLLDRHSPQGDGWLTFRHGDWWLGNLQMESALKFAGYDIETVWGEGGHNGKHGGAIFPDTMRWLWRDWKPTR